MGSATSTRRGGGRTKFATGPIAKFVFLGCRRLSESSDVTLANYAGMPMDHWGCSRLSLCNEHLWMHRERVSLDQFRGATFGLRLLVKSIGEIQKGTAGRGREKKCHDNLRQTSRQFTTCHDNLRHFMTISVSLFH